MEKLRAILVDDEFFARENLKMLLEDYASENVHLIGEAASVKEALELCEKNKIDLVFLDIMMPESDGFAFLEQVKDRSFQVVFTTAFREYAVKAIKENALDYLEKPIDIEELKNVISKAVKNQEQQTGSIDENKINRVLQEIALHSNFDKTIVPTRDGFVILRNNEIREQQEH
jgi:two-component system LytT family response regulator